MKKENRFLNWTSIIISIFIIVLSFVLGYPLDGKILMLAVGISLLSNLIDNKKIRFTIKTICLLVILFVGFRWYF